MATLLVARTAQDATASPAMPGPAMTSPAMTSPAMTSPAMPGQRTGYLPRTAAGRVTLAFTLAVLLAAVAAVVAMRYGGPAHIGAMAYNG